MLNTGLVHMNCPLHNTNHHASLPVQNGLLEDSGEELTESFVMQLVALQQTADELCSNLDSTHQMVAQQAYDYDALLDIKNRLETEILDYKMMLDGLNEERYEPTIMEIQHK